MAVSEGVNMLHLLVGGVYAGEGPYKHWPQSRVP